MKNIPLQRFKKVTKILPHFPEWLNLKLFLMLFSLLLLICTSIFASYKVANQYRGDQLLINLADRQRILVIKMVQDRLLDYKLTAPGTAFTPPRSELPNGNIPIVDPQFLFEQTARAMLYGGKVIENMYAPTGSNDIYTRIQPLKDEQGRAYLLDALKKFSTIKKFLSNLSPQFTWTEHKLAAEIILEESNAMVLSMNDLTLRLQKLSESKVKYLSIIRKLSSLTTFILFIFLVVFLQQKVSVTSELKENERKFRTLFEQSKDALYISSKEGTFLDVNQAAVDLFGYNRKQMIGMNLRKIYTTYADRGKFNRETDAKGYVRDFDLNLRKKDGTAMDCQITASVRRDKAGNILGYEGIIRDITERKRAEKALQKETVFVKLLKEVAVAANEALSVKEVMDITLNQVCTLTGWPVGHVYAYSGSDILKNVLSRTAPPISITGELVPTTLWYLEDAGRFETFRQITEQTNFAPEVGLPGRVFSSGKPAWVVDVTKDPNFPRTKLAEDIGVKGAFAFPILLQGEVVTIMEFFSSVEEVPDEPLLEIMANIGAQIGHVIERWQSQNKLKKLSSAVEQAADSVVITNKEGIIEYVNPAFVIQTGFTKEEVLGKTPQLLKSGKHSKRYYTKLWEEILSGKVFRGELINKKKNGELYYESKTISPVRNAHGDIEYYVSTGKDITEHKQAEKLKTSIYRLSEAAQSSENLDELFQVIHNIIGDLMPTKNFYIALYDDKKELLSFPYFVDEYDEQPPTPKKLRKGLSEYVLRTGKPLLASSEMIEEFVDKKEIKVIGTIPIVWLGMPLKTKDKTLGLIATQSYTKSAKLTDEHKSILKFVSAQIAMAIQHKQAEEENRILARFPADNPNPIMRVRSDTTILYANKPSITLLDNWHTKVGQLLPDNWRKTIQDVLNAGSSKNLEIKIKDQIFSFVVTPMSDSDIVYLYALDVTGRKRAEENLREINQEVVRTNARLVTTMRELEKARDELESALDTAEESDKLKGEFLANTSHELRTPLNSIIGFLQLIKDGMCDSPEEEREFLTNALMSSNHLLKLINDVLDIAKIEAGKFEVYLQPISLSNLFDEVYLLTSIQASKNKINLEFLFEEKEEIFIYADLDKAKQILLNLIGNSLKFTPKGGIHVSGKAIHKEGVAMIQINDTGIGIPLDKQKRIFEKFNQADGSSSRKYGGTGLGLSITKNLVKLMGGSIELSSPGVNMGTVVSFTLPLSKETTRTESEIQMTVEAF